jgi:histidyl-tRNA synthetase
MHKLAQPVKLWYLSSFYRYERAQAGPLPPVLAGRRRGDRLDDPAVDAESIALPGDAARAPRHPGRRAAHRQPGHAGDPCVYRDKLQAHLRAHADELSEEVRGRIELNPLRAFDSDHRARSA